MSLIVFLFMVLQRLELQLGQIKIAIEAKGRNRKSFDLGGSFYFFGGEIICKTKWRQKIVKRFTLLSKRSVFGTILRKSRDWSNALAGLTAISTSIGRVKSQIGQTFFLQNYSTNRFSDNNARKREFPGIDVPFYRCSISSQPVIST